MILLIKTFYASIHVSIDAASLSTMVDTTIQIKGENFSILEVPEASTALVRQHEQYLLAGVDLEALVTDLSRVGKFVRIAYNGVAGYTELQIKIRRIAVNVSRLCDKSAITVGMFKQASGTVLVDLQATYHFLIDGLEDMGIETFRSTSRVAEEMKEAAQKLAEEFEKESERVEEALVVTMQTKDSEEERKKLLEEKAKRSEIERARAEEERKVTEQDIGFHEGMYESAASREAAGGNLFLEALNVLASPFTGGQKLFDTDEPIRAARREKEKHLDEMRELRKIRSKALQDIAEYTMQMQNCRNDAELSQAAISSLHQAMGGLKCLSVVMRKIAYFWEKVEAHCKNLASQDMQKMIDIALKKDPDDRIKVWISPGFKKKAMDHYAKWVALDRVCEAYLGQIKVTQRELYDNLMENLTTEQARRNVRQLAATFSEELQIAQKEIADQQAKDELERQNLDQQ